MNTINQNYLPLSWATSRGQDTYGYNICRLDDNATNARYKCMGGGYDMIGTVVAQWLVATYQARLVTIADKLSATYTKANGYVSSDDNRKLYGGCFHADENRVTINGACGLESVRAIADAIGVNITSNYNKRKQRTDGFFVSENALVPTI